MLFSQAGSRPPEASSEAAYSYNERRDLKNLGLLFSSGTRPSKYARIHELRAETSEELTYSPRINRFRLFNQHITSSRESVNSSINTYSPKIGQLRWKGFNRGGQFPLDVKLPLLRNAKLPKMQRTKHITQISPAVQTPQTTKGLSGTSGLQRKFSFLRKPKLSPRLKSSNNSTDYLQSLLPQLQRAIRLKRSIKPKKLVPSQSRVNIDLGSVSVTGMALTGPQTAREQQQTPEIKAPRQSLFTSMETMPYRINRNIKTYRSLREKKKEAERKKQ